MSHSQHVHVWAVDQFEAFKIKSCKRGKMQIEEDASTDSKDRSAHVSDHLTGVILSVDAS